MAETSTAAQFPTSGEFQKYWETMVAANPVQKLSYTPVEVDEVTEDSAANKIQSWLNPYIDKSVKARQANTRANQADLAADAYSRGMGSSTWLSDQNSRQFAAEQGDISNLRANASMTLAQGIADELSSYRNRKLQADTTNAQNRASVDSENLRMEAQLKETLWSQFMNQFNMGLFEKPSSGGDPDPDPDPKKFVYSPISGTYIPTSASPTLPQYSASYILRNG